MSKLLRHTDECWDYAAKTSRQSGVHWCIGACSRLRRGDITEAQYLAEMRSGKPTPGIDTDRVPESPDEIRDLLQSVRAKPIDPSLGPFAILGYLTEECGISRDAVREQLVAINWQEALSAHDKVSAELASR